MARTVVVILSRRTRSLFLNVKESVRIAPQIAQLLAKKFSFDKA